MSDQIALRNFLPVSHSDSVSGGKEPRNQEFCLVQDEYFLDLLFKSVYLKPKANIIFDGETPETPAWQQ